MRRIGELSDEVQAKRLGDLLFAKGVENQVEISARKTWEIWVLEDDQRTLGEETLRAFLAEPDHPEFQNLASQAERLRRKAEKDEKKAAKLYRGREALLSPGLAQTMPVTLVLMALSIGVAILTRLGQHLEPGYGLLISEPISVGQGMMWRTDFPEILSGQIWRLVTPIFLHFGLMHLVFNLLWLKDLGGLMERRFGWKHYLLFLLITAALSNVGQYIQSGPMFGGLSGVVYGLLGFVWIRGKVDPFSGVYLHPTTVTMMIVWYVVCLVGLVGHVANTVHTIGLLAGVGWGYVSARRALSHY